MLCNKHSTAPEGIRQLDTEEKEIFNSPCAVEERARLLSCKDLVSEDKAQQEKEATKGIR